MAFVYATPSFHIRHGGSVVSASIATPPIAGHARSSTISPQFETASAGLVGLSALVACTTHRRRASRSSAKIGRSACIAAPLPPCSSTPPVLDDMALATEALKLQCKVTGADYAIYWRESNGEYLVGGYYDTPDYIEKLREKRGATNTFSSWLVSKVLECQNVEMDSPQLLAMVQERRQPVFIRNTSNCGNHKREAWFKEFSIRSVCAIPLAGGIIEYGTEGWWDEPPCPVEAGTGLECIRPAKHLTLQAAYQKCFEANLQVHEAIKKSYQRQVEKYTPKASADTEVNGWAKEALDEWKQQAHDDYTKQREGQAQPILPGWSRNQWWYKQ